MNDIKKIKDYSTKELREICQSTAPDPAHESYVGIFCRIFSIYATRLFLYTKITPNQITILSVLVFFCGISLFFVGNQTYNIFASVLIFLSIIIDGSDGEVARFRKSRSSVGSSYTEPVSHDIQYGFSFALLGLAVYLNTGQVHYLFLGSIASIFKLEYRLLESRFLNLIKSVNSEQAGGKEQNEKKNNFSMTVAGWVNRNLFSSTGFFLVMLIVSVTNKIGWSLWFYGIGFSIFWLALFFKHILFIKKMR